MRLPEGPWYRAQCDAWYVKIDGRQVRLAKGKANKKAALEAFHRLMALGPAGLPKKSELLTAHVCDLFLKWSERHHDERTFRWYRSFLNSFCNCESVGTLAAAEVKPYHVTHWLDEHPKWKNSRRCAVICVKRAFNWAHAEGLLKENPLRSLKKPPAVRRERIVTPEEWAALVAAVRDQEFRDFLFALRETGCRPGEVRKVTAEQVNLELGVWVLEQHKTRKKTGLPRVVYLTPGMVELCKRLCERWPEGPIFRGPERKGDRPYSRNALRCRFRRLRVKLPQLKGVISYTLRHTYITDALERGVPVATVAELAGHKDLKMIQQHHAHLSEKRQHLQDAARRAAGYAEGRELRRRPEAGRLE
jgi:integrase